MGSPMKIRTKLEGDVVQVRVLMSHPMETGQRKTPEGQLIPAHFIQLVDCHATRTAPCCRRSGARRSRATRTCRSSSRAQPKARRSRSPGWTTKGDSRTDEAIIE